MAGGGEVVGQGSADCGLQEGQKEKELGPQGKATSRKTQVPFQAAWTEMLLDGGAEGANRPALQLL